MQLVELNTSSGTQSVLPTAVVRVFTDVSDGVTVIRLNDGSAIRVTEFREEVRDKINDALLDDGVRI